MFWFHFVALCFQSGKAGSGCVILAFGMTNVIKFDAGTGPNDLVTVVISDNSAKESSPPASRGCEARAQQNNTELAGIPSCQLLSYTCFALSRPCPSLQGVDHLLLRGKALGPRILGGVLPEQRPGALRRKQWNQRKRMALNRYLSLIHI